MVAATKDGRVDFAGLIGLHEDHLAVMARHGDREAIKLLWELSVPQVARVTHGFAARYPWINHSDLSQDVLADFPKFIQRYDPTKAHSWNKFFYFTIYHAAQDALRKEDPLGVRIPQKKPYPAWRRLSDLADDPYILEGVVLDGLDNLDRNYATNLDPVASWDAKDVHPDHIKLRNRSPRKRKRKVKR